MRRINTKQLMEEKHLTTTEKLFYVYLVDVLCNEAGICQLPVAELHKLTQFGVGSLNDGIKKLMATGYIRGVLIPNRSGHNSWLIHLTPYGLLKEGEAEPAKPIFILPEPASIDAGPVRITITVEPRDL